MYLTLGNVVGEILTRRIHPGHRPDRGGQIVGLLSPGRNLPVTRGGTENHHERERDR